MKMFVLNPDPYLLPAFRISPFTTQDITINENLPGDSSVDRYFDQRFGKGKYQYTLNGREAINIALRHYQLKKEDLVTILTTSGNFYISRCVTDEIEKFCKWSRQIEDRTKVILVNHEFGFPYKSTGKLKELNIPIIEDCAHSFFSEDEKGEIGTTGDFCIYSFPKMFSLQIGGLLVSNFDAEGANSSQINIMQLRYIKSVLSHQITSRFQIISQRIENYNYLKEKFETTGFSERFQIEPGIVPGVFMFRANENKIELQKLKEFFYDHGIQCSVFYGEESFFIPVHQNLTSTDCEYFITVFKKFLMNYSND